MKNFEELEHLAQKVITLDLTSKKASETLHQLDLEPDEVDAEKVAIAANLATALKSVPRMPIVDAVMLDKELEKIDITDLDTAIPKLNIIAKKQKKQKKH
jgi:hypothetical protein